MIDTDGLSFSREELRILNELLKETKKDLRTYEGKVLQRVEDKVLEEFMKRVRFGPIKLSKSRS